MSATVGRPPQELDAKRRKDLSRARARVDVLEAKLADAKLELSRVAAAALDDGASIRALAEELGLSKAGALSLARRGR